jgi:serine/threonine protein kinase
MARRTIRFRGRTYRVQKEVHLGGKTYCLVERLSSGSRERYKAIDPVSDKVQAIAILPKASTSLQRLRILEELANRNPRSFPMVMDIDPRGESYKVLQAWVRGHDLSKKIRHAEQHPERWPGPLESFHIFRNLAHGLFQLHRETGLIHGDIKPANLVMDRTRVYIVDFGSAWFFEQAAYRTEGEGISGAYASPEQHRGETAISFRSDYFSAAVIAYQLFTRQLPYDGLGGKAGRSEYGDAFAKKLVRPSDFNPQHDLLPGDFWHSIDEIVLKNLALNPAERSGRDDWLQGVDSLNARLRLGPQLSPISKGLLGIVDWFSGRFRRRSSQS